MKTVFQHCLEKLRYQETIFANFKLVSIKGSLIEAVHPRLGEQTVFSATKTAPTRQQNQSSLNISIGSYCEIVTPTGLIVPGEVIAMENERLTLLTLEKSTEIPLTAMLRFPTQGRNYTIKVGSLLLGRVMDSLGQPLDEKGPIITDETRSFFANSPPALTRQAISEPFSTGISSIDGLLTVGKGQRVGIFAGTGVGKTTLLSMIARHSTSDVIIVALIGERGREVNDFIKDGLSPQARKNAIIVVASPDDPPLKRIRAAYTATTLGEYFRDQGKSVVLVLDSLTRLAYAQRELSLLRNEPPASRGYPPSVFSTLNDLLERAGNNQLGSLTAFYNILVEGDDMDEPISDATRGMLDGHIVLTRALAEQGHFPAINVPASISRLMRQICHKKHLNAATTLNAWIARHQEMEDLINIGAYAKGSDPLLDTALAHKSAWLAFLQQNADESRSFIQTREKLMHLCPQST